MEGALNGRLALITGKVPTGIDTMAAFKAIDDASVAYALALKEIFLIHKADTGRAIATLDHVQFTKNIAYDAVRLPMAK